MQKYFNISGAYIRRRKKRMSNKTDLVPASSDHAQSHHIRSPYPVVVQNEVSREELVEFTKLTKEQYDRALKKNASLQKDIIKDTVKKRAIAELDIEKTAVNLDATIDSFLRCYNSMETRRSYQKTIAAFLAHLDLIKCDLFQLTRGVVQNYKDELYNEYSSASAKQKVATLQAFWRKGLMRDHPKVFTVNHFENLRLEPTVSKYAKDVITNTMFKRICVQLLDDDRVDVLCVVKFLERTGERIGIFKNMVITNKRTFAYDATSKGKCRVGKLTKEEYRVFDFYGIIGMDNLHFVQECFRRACKKLHDKGKLDCIPSVHDLRRRRIALDVKNCKDYLAVVAVSQRFHKNIGTTMAYIESVADVNWTK